MGETGHAIVQTGIYYHLWVLTFHCNWCKKILSNDKLVQIVFCQRKCTAVAANNLPAHMCYKGLCSIRNIWEFFPGHNSHVEGPIEVLPADPHWIQSTITTYTQHKPLKQSWPHSQRKHTIASNTFNNVCYNITYDINVNHPASYVVICHEAFACLTDWIEYIWQFADTSARNFCILSTNLSLSGAIVLNAMPNSFWMYLLATRLKIMLLWGIYYGCSLI